MRGMARREKDEIVTIDGPSGVGKSSLSRQLALALGYTYLDTGAMYRAVGLFLRDLHIDLDDDQAVAAALPGLDLHLFPVTEEDGDVRVVVNGQEVGRLIRSPEMGMLASRVSAIPVVRTHLTRMQQAIGRQGRIVAEGRDTGTVVFPRARWKFYLEAAPEERARRRVAQLLALGQEVDSQKVLEMTIQRDHDDQSRAIAPLLKAEDALLIDTSCLDIETVCRKMLAVVRGG